MEIMFPPLWPSPMNTTVGEKGSDGRNFCVEPPLPHLASYLFESLLHVGCNKVFTHKSRRNIFAFIKQWFIYYYIQNATTGISWGRMTCRLASKTKVKWKVVLNTKAVLLQFVGGLCVNDDRCFWFSLKMRVKLDMLRSLASIRVLCWNGKQVKNCFWEAENWEFQEENCLLVMMISAEKELTLTRDTDTTVANLSCS